MSALKAGDSFPEGVEFTYVPPSPDSKDITVCGLPQKYDASKEFQNKKVVVVAVPGAFTPTCQANHIPGFTGKISELKAKGVDQVVVIAFNDAFVMSAWGKANNAHDDFIVFATDDDIKFSSKIGWTVGNRSARFAMIVDHGKVTYAEREESPKDVTVSGADAVLSKL